MIIQFYLRRRDVRLHQQSSIQICRRYRQSRIQTLQRILIQTRRYQIITFSHLLYKEYEKKLSYQRRI